MKSKWIRLCALALFAAGYGASVSASDYTTCTNICLSERTACIRNHGGANACEATYERCVRSCMVVSPLLH